MLKPEIVAKLEELKIPFKPSQPKDELYALIPDDVRTQIEADEKAAAEKEAADKAEADAKAKAEADKANEKDVANVYSDRGQFVRAYTLEAHGNDFHDLATEFIGHPGRQNFTIRMDTKSAEPVKEEPVPVPMAEVWSNNQLVRVYNKNDHGEEYESLAHQFADRQGFQVTTR